MSGTNVPAGCRAIGTNFHEQLFGGAPERTMRGARVMVIIEHEPRIQPAIPMIQGGHAVAVMLGRAPIER